MKFFMPIIFLAAVVLTSCGTKQTKEESNTESDPISEESIEGNDVDEAKNCNEFIDQYEEWMDNYVVLIEKYMKNPMDAALSEEYMKLAQEGMSWMNQWNSKLIYCGSVDKYEKRFEEISEKAEKKLEEMGIE